VIRLKLNSSKTGERGFTLIELLVAIAITAVVGSTITIAITQVFSVSIVDRNHMEAVKQVENAVHYLNRDAQMAGSVVPTGDDFPLVLTWNEWNVTENDLSGPQHQVTYSIVSNNLKREEIIGTNPATTYIVANSISDASNCSFTDSVLTVNLTATVGGYKPVSETRSLEVKSRPEPLESSP
jgi:prepilin-type N-terminal cleavage/methylation domain-containing protein